MVSLREYVKNVLEQHINEAFFQRKDYDHRGDYKYIKKLFGYLFGEVDNLTIRICNKPSLNKYTVATIDNSIILTRDDFDVNKIKDNLGNPRTVDEIDFTKYSYKEISDILRDALIGYNDIVQLTSKSLLLNRLDKIPLSGYKITTHDNEVATCVLFNTLVERCKNIDEFDSIINDTNNKDSLKDIYDIISDISNNFDNQWLRSFMYQMQAISKLIRDEHQQDQFKNLKMERYDGDKNYPDWTLSRKYASLIKSYVSRLLLKKDNIDPSDVILYNINDTSKIESILDRTFEHIKNVTHDTDNHNVDYANVKREFLKLYNVDVEDDNNNDHSIFFYGISLKKLINSPIIDKFNITDKTLFVIDEFEDINNNKYKDANKTIFCIVRGKIVNKSKHSHIIDDGEDQNDEILTNKNDRYKITLRTNGDKICVDVSKCRRSTNESYTTDATLGKCPVKIWNDILRKFVGKSYKSSPGPNDIVAYKDAFKQLCECKDNELRLYISDIITSAIKCGPNCMPFIIIH